MDPCAHFCLCVWFHSLCLSVFPSCRAPDKVIRAVTGVAHLHCLSDWCLCGVVSDRCCSCPVLLYVSLSSWVCFCLLAVLDSLEGENWSEYSLPVLDTLHCRISTVAVFWSCLIKTIYFTRNWVLSFCFMTEWFDHYGSSECIRFKIRFVSQ